MKVAVYGSLKRNFHNFDVMESAGGIFIGNAITKDTDFIMCGHGYPFVVKSNDLETNRAVSVEIFEVPEEGVINHLDRLEGHPTFYKRTLIPFNVEEGGEVEAWMYLYQSDISPDVALLQNGIYTW